MDGGSSFKPSWDFYAISLIALFVFYQGMQWPLLPKFVDIYYHLSVVKGFSDAGGWVARDTWEFAPGGQPHLYPPLLHILLLIPYRLGLDAISLARAVDALSYPALLAAFWAFVRSREEARKAFWALLLFSTVYSSFLSAVTLPAFNLAMIFSLAALYFLASGRGLAAGLMAAAVCYTHTLAAGLLAGMFAAAAWLDPSSRKKALRAFLLAAVLALPILIWQLSQARAFSMIEAGENRLIEFDPVLYALAAVRIVRSARRRKPDVWPLALLAGMAPAIPFRQARILGGYAVLAAAWLAALEVLSWLDGISQKRGKKIAVEAGLLAALFFGFLAPTCLWNRMENRFRVEAADRTLVRYLIPDESRDFKAKGFSIYFPKEYAQVLEVLNARLKPGEVFWTDFPHAGGIFYLLSGRSMTTSMLGEVGSWKDRQARLNNAKLLIWFKNADGLAGGDAPSLIQSMGLLPVAETDVCFIFENPTGGSQVHPAKAVIPASVLWALLAAWGGVLFYASRREI